MPRDPCVLAVALALPDDDSSTQIDGEEIDPDDEVRTERLGTDEAPDGWNTYGELFEQDVDLHARQAGTEAEMRSAATERKVIVRLAFDVEAERVVEHVLVAVRRRVPDADLVTSLQLLPSQLGVGDDVAPEVHDR